MMRCRSTGLKSIFTTKPRASAAAGDGSRHRSDVSGSACAITKGERRALVSMTMLSLTLSLLVASSVPARVSPSCMSFTEARAAFPGRHLWWHGRHGKCWDDRGGAAAANNKTRTQPLPPQRPDKTPMIMFPTLVEGAAPDAQMLSASMTDGPLLLDIDEITANKQDPPDCCWPQLSEAPAATFHERWMAMPPAWVLASRQ